MPRAKGGTKTRARHKKRLKMAKGYYGAKSKLFRSATEQVDKGLQYAYRDRKAKKRDFRRLWIARINAAAGLAGISYSRFINALKKANIGINRKMLAELAVNDIEGFNKIVDVAKQHLVAA
jgi:large subunit ribosomal protein L20